MKVLITGASGFIGKNLINILDFDGCEIHAIYNQNKPSNNLKNINYLKLASIFPPSTVIIFPVVFLSKL